jgi:very-short-patch-repair endonuclease
LRTPESKQKTSNSVKNSIKINGCSTPQFTKIKYSSCNVCESPFRWDSIHRGYTNQCSKECYTKHQSTTQSNRLKDQNYRKNYGRGKPSYLEDSFSKWLDSHNLSYKTELQIYNEELKKNYFCDFFFPELNLIIELDGNQHLKTIEKDAIRDAYIKKIFGYNILRISHKEYIKKEKLDLVRNLLSI